MGTLSTSNHPPGPSKNFEAWGHLQLLNLRLQLQLNSSNFLTKQIAGWANPHSGGTSQVLLFVKKKKRLNVFESPWMKHSSMSQDSCGSYVVTCDLTGIFRWLVTIRQSKGVLSMQRGQLRECFIKLGHLLRVKCLSSRSDVTTGDESYAHVQLPVIVSLS